MSKMQHGTTATGGRAGRVPSGRLIAVRLIASLCLAVTIPTAEAQEQEKVAPTAAPSGDSLTREGRQKLTRELREHDDQAGRLFQQGRFAEARRSRERSLEILEQLYPKARFPKGHADLPRMMSNLALIEMSLEQYPQALEHFQKSLAMIKVLAPTGGPWCEANLVFLAEHLTEGGSRLVDLELPEEAEHYLRLAIEVFDLIDPKWASPERSYALLAQAWAGLSCSLKDQKRFTEAEAGYRRVLGMLEQLHPRENSKSGLFKATLLPKVLHDRGLALKDVGKLREAAESLRKALELWPKTFLASDTKREGAIIWSLGWLARTLYDLHDLEAAESASREALARARRVFGDQGVESLDALRVIGIVLRARGQIDGAERTLREALAIARELFPESKYPEGHPELAMTLGELASVHADKGDYGEAMRLIERSLAMSHARNDQDLPLLLDKSASIHILLGERRTARKFAQFALQLREQIYSKDKFPNGHRDLAASMLRLAETFDEPEGTGVIRLGERKRNIQSVGDGYRRALDMCKAQFPEHEFPKGHPALAEALWLAGRWAINWNVDVAGGFGGKAELIGPAKADCIRSLDMLEQLYPKARFPLGHPVLAARLSEMGALLTDLSEFDAAVEYGRRGREMSERLYPKEQYPQGHPALAQALYNMGLIHVSRGYSFEIVDYEKARMRKARKREEFKLAWDFLQRAQAMSQHFVNTMFADCSEAQALNYRSVQPPALDLMLSIRWDVPLSGLEEVLYDAVAASKSAPFRAAQRRERLLRESTDPAVQSLASKLRETRRQLAPLLIGATEAEMNGLGLRHGVAYEKERLERAIAERLPRYGQGHEVADMRASDLRKMLPQGTALVEFLLLRACEPALRFKAGPGPEGEKVIVGRADSHRQSVYHAFIVRPDAPTLHLVVGEPFINDREVLVWREQIARADVRSFGYGYGIRDSVWSQIEQALGPTTSSVLIAPDGQLARIPWAAIPGRGVGRILLEDYALAVVPNGLYAMEQLAHAPIRQSAMGRLLAVGDVDYDKRPASPDESNPPAKTRPLLHSGKKVQWTRLPGTRTELDAIVSVAGTREVIRLTGEAATTDRILHELPRARWAHLAIHGFFDDPEIFLNSNTMMTFHGKGGDLNNFIQGKVTFGERSKERHLPNSFFKDDGGIYRRERVLPFERNAELFSGLVFAGANLPVPEAQNGLLLGEGGSLTAEAIADVPLNDVELVVLSACESGLGDLGYGLGVLGLQRAFHVAGVRDVVGTLWKIDDETTAAMMRVFYHKLWVESKPPIEALREAQLAIYYHPERIGALTRSRGVDFSKEVAVASSLSTAKSGRAPIKLWAGVVFSGPARRGTPAVRYNLADATKGRGRTEEALIECREVIRLNPNDSQAHVRLGKALRDMDRFHDWSLREAIREFREAVRLNPESAEARYELGLALYQNWLRDSRYTASPRNAAVNTKAPMEVFENEEGQFEEVEVKLQQAVAEFRAAVRLKPDFAVAYYELGIALQDQGKVNEAVAEYRAAIRLKPNFAEAHYNLGTALPGQGKGDEAVAEYRTAIRLKPNFAEAHYNLGTALSGQGKGDEAVAEYRQAIQHKPDYAKAHYNLGHALSDQGKGDEAIAEYRTAIRLKPDFAEAHCILGYALYGQGKRDEAIAEYRTAIQHKPDYAEAHVYLGLALSGQGKREEAIAEYRVAIQHKPDYAEAHVNLGHALSDQGKRDEAIAEYRVAIQHKPDYAEAHYILGLALSDQSKRDEAIAEYRTAIRHKPDFAEAHVNLGLALSDQSKRDEAIAEYRAAIRHKPDYAEAHYCLALGLEHEADWEGALASLRQARILAGSDTSFASAIDRTLEGAQRMAALSPRLQAILKGADRPANAAEAADFGRLATLKAEYSASARLYAEAFKADPKLADDLAAAHRYNAACSAALAGCGQGKDDPAPDEAGRAKLRRQALDWLTADLALRSQQLESGKPEARTEVIQKLTHWKVDRDLAGVRDPSDLAKLPDDEQKAWRALWVQVEALEKKAQGNRPQP